ncbi:uncharacterized protein N7483_007608 [Penicillium malachiteum]|uniref:uncharacterized protein n=1 Tax=Penicillium malachiteum TaxID=1324776 RepID=UPI002547D719|nr:uncharacterized protein N7483_007608 [Penicillium malachiteum]KAJ5726251.1 hypothetical protein N7483_007608 [Penicillium malachiteum]
MSTKDPKEEYNIQETWERVCASFAESTKINLTDSPKYTPDDVIEQIRARQEEEDEKNAKYKAAKDAIGKTVKCIMLLGGIAAQGASMVFAPSSLCFNAISYLLDAGMKYKRIFSSLSELFRRVSDVLERCKIYLRLPPETIDILLRKIINEEMLCFVDICALSIKVLRGHKVFTALKVIAFDSDEGVSCQLNRLKDLAEREDQIRATLGFEKQLQSHNLLLESAEGNRKIRASMDMVLSLEEKRDMESAQKTLLTAIDASLDDASKEYNRILEDYRQTLSARVQESGKWLQTDRSYIAWVGGVSTPFSILGLSGAEGHGKSFLCATIFENLQEISSHIGEDLSCTSSAFYAFGNQSTSLMKALKVLSWQIVNTDIVYRKTISFSNSISKLDLPTLWETLFAKLYKGDSTCFLVLDGVENMDSKSLKEFTQMLAELKLTSANWPRFKLRLLLSSRDETMHKIQHDLGLNNISVIEVASKNKDDLERFIDNGIENMPIFEKASKQPEILELRKMILETLTENTGGDFVNAKLLLDEISGKQRPSEITDILSRSRGNRSDTIARKIEVLNDTLTATDISDLNELLMWVVFAKRKMYVEELETVVRSRATETSLWPLEDKITQSYSPLLRIIREKFCQQDIAPILKVGLVSSSIEEFLRMEAKSGFLARTRNTTTSDTVHELEVGIVRRFLESVCDPKLYSKFGFEEFFQQKLRGSRGRVGIDLEAAHSRILTTCLETILADESSTLKRLIPYAEKYFTDHLKMVDLSLIQPESKISIGLQLMRLLTDYTIIERLCPEGSYYTPHHWLYSDDNAEVALRWLQDSAVLKCFSTEQSEWVKSLSSKAEPDTDILEHIARYFARKWLQGDENDNMAPFLWVYAYFKKIENRKNPEIKRLSQGPSMKDIEASQVLDAAKWAQTYIGLHDLGYEGNCHIAYTLRQCGKINEAIEQFRLASSLQHGSWNAKKGMADCYASQKEYDLAIATMEDAVIELEKTDMEDKEEFVSEMHCMIAEWNADAGYIDVAIQRYQALIQSFPMYTWGSSCEVIGLLHRRKDYERMLGFIKTFDDLTMYSDDESSTEDEALTPQASLFKFVGVEDVFAEAVFAMVSTGRGFDIVLKGYQTAIAAIKQQVAKEEDWKRSDQGLMMHQLAFICYFCEEKDQERREFAIDLWLKVLQLEETVEDWLLLQVKQTVRVQVAVAYFTESQRDSGSPTLYLEQLQQMATLDSTLDHCHRRRDGAYPKQLIARYHTLHGDERSAINTLRINIKVNLDILEDDDPLNDWQGFLGLAKNFMFAGQDDDSLAAWSLITPQDRTNHKTTEPSTSGVPKDELKGPLREDCYANCHTFWTFANDIYVCRECDSVHFDSHCLAKLRAGSLDSWCCNKNHDMLHVPAYDPSERQRIGDGNVKVGQEIIQVDEWLQRIRVKWDIKPAH